MITPFGKEVRKYRIDHAMTLKEMADGVGVSSAYLSSVETGKKTITTELVDKIIKLLMLNREDVKKLNQSVDVSRLEYSVKGSGCSDDTKEMVTMFARSFSGLSKEKQDDIKRMLKNK
ncbi:MULTISPECIES: helix-turn-helix transcriptional regulator [unclassified Endozoicomonas]|uniref:helix-turn-helix transcriptional regulator n=1 Tax=unclassified Endozoicomonas TaxID=2644528 RepID=UPI003BB7E5B3